MSSDTVKEMARGLTNIVTKSLSPAEIVILSSHSRDKERHSYASAFASALNITSNGHKSHPVPDDDSFATGGHRGDDLDETDRYIIDVSNIHEDLEAEDCIIQFGTSLYDHMNLSLMHSPFLDDGAHENSRMSNDIREDPSHSPKKLAKSILQANEEADLDISNQRLIVADDDENDYEENNGFPGRRSPVVTDNGHDHSLLGHFSCTSSTGHTKNHSVVPRHLFDESGKQLRPAANFHSSNGVNHSAPVSFATSTSELTDRRNRSHSHSILGSTSSDGQGQGIALSSVISSHNTEIETYKMKFNTILLKYNILKNDFEQMTADLQRKVNENCSIILQLQTVKSK
jgi:hypothetical protein